MKITLSNLFRVAPWAAALVSVLCFSGCGSDSEPEPEPTEAQRVTEILTAGGGTWSPPASAGVLIDGVDVTQELFAGFTITFGDGTFTTTGTSPVWLREDTWRFKDESAKIIVRGQDDREITIQEISSTQLKLTLYWPETTNSGGRTGSLKGNHEFFLNK